MSSQTQATPNSTQATTKPTQTFRLLDLSPELRGMIYTLVIDTHNSTMGGPAENFKTNLEPPLLLVSHQVRDEAMKNYYLWILAVADDAVDQQKVFEEEIAEAKVLRKGSKMGLFALMMANMAIQKRYRKIVATMKRKVDLLSKEGYPIGEWEKMPKAAEMMRNW